MVFTTGEKKYQHQHAVSVTLVSSLVSLMGKFENRDKNIF